MMAKTQEPDTAPRADKWYRLKLGPTISEQNSSRFYTLRYEFKPASIDTGTPGTLHKGVENKVTVEFSNNQAGKPKVAFQGNSEDCKDLDAIIFFDGTSFRLERLHRAVKSLRHVRLPGESASAVAAAAAASASGLEPPRSSPVHLNGSAGAVQALAPSERNPFKAHVVRTYCLVHGWLCTFYVPLIATSREVLEFPPDLKWSKLSTESRNTPEITAGTLCVS
jgi:ELL-associated factor